MNENTPMTPAQQLFAEEHHNLVYAFLNEKKLPEDEALTLAYRSIQGGARGLDMGRNIFQSNHPVEMAKAIRMIVHQKATDKEAFEFYTDAIHTK